jgi:hypothetical protein
MDNSSNFKDTVTNYCGLVFAICTALVSLSGTISLPTAVTTICGILIAVSGGVIGYYTGKAPNGNTKSGAVIENENKP